MLVFLLTGLVILIPIVGILHHAHPLPMRLWGCALLMGITAEIVANLFLPYL